MSCQRLSDSQRDRAEKYAHLINWYMKLFRLYDDDWYGVIAVSLCEASASYDPTRGTFEAYARRCASNAVVDEYRYQRAHCPPVAHNVDVDYIVRITGEPFTRRSDWDAIICGMDAVKRQVVRMRIYGYSDDEIASHTGMTYAQARYQRNRATAVLQEAIDG